MLKLLKNLHYIVGAVGIVLIWRGVWGLADVYLLFSTPLVSFAVSILLGILILLLLGPKRFTLDELE
jgi:hypothetical protein